MTRSTFESSSSTRLLDQLVLEGTGLDDVDLSGTAVSADSPLSGYLSCLES